METQNMRLLDRNGDELKVGTSVKFHARKNDDEFQEGFARIEKWQDGRLEIKIWIEDWSSYGSDAMSWPIKKTEKDDFVTYFAKDNGEINWLEITKDAKPLDNPIEEWPSCLSFIMEEFMAENNIKFCFRGEELPLLHTVDPNGMLGAIVHAGEKTMRIMYGEDRKLPILYYAHPKALTYMSFAFNQEDTTDINTLFHHSHLLVDTLTRIVEENKLNPDNLIDGMIQIDKYVGEWIHAKDNKKIVVMPYRPRGNEIVDSGGGGMAPKKMVTQGGIKK